MLATQYSAIHAIICSSEIVSTILMRLDYGKATEAGLLANDYQCHVASVYHESCCQVMGDFFTRLCSYRARFGDKSL